MHVGRPALSQGWSLVEQSVSAVIARIRQLLSKPYPLNLDFRRNLSVVFWFSIAIAVFLILFQPLGLSAFRHPHKKWILLSLGLVCFAVTVGNVVLVPRFWRRPFDAERWTVGRELLWSGWLFLSALLVVAVYWAWIVGLTLSLRYFVLFSLNGFLLTAFFMPTCVLLNYLRMLQIRLREAQALNAQLSRPSKAGRGETVVLISETGKERLELPSDRLLYIQAADNYANVVCRRNGQVRETLLRTSLRNLERQLLQPYLVRCHRSFIVNLKQVRTVSGNARHYTLWLRDCDQAVPVSRELEKQVLHRLRALQGP